jgi:hypothetical protein
MDHTHRSWCACISIRRPGVKRKHG